MEQTQHIPRIVTLGGDSDLGLKLTCSYQAALESFPTSEILPVGSFEIGREMIISKEAELLYVPAAYPGTVDFLMDSHLKVVDSTVHIIPELVLATKLNNKNKYVNVYSHVSPSRLLKESSFYNCLLYTSPSPRDKRQSRMPSSA